MCKTLVGIYSLYLKGELVTQKCVKVSYGVRKSKLFVTSLWTFIPIPSFTVDLVRNSNN